MAVSLWKSGETSLSLARKARQEIQEGNVGAAKASLAKVERSAGKHIEEIEYLLERYAIVQKEYEEQERVLTRRINDVLEKERYVEIEKSVAERQLSFEKNELSDLNEALNKAEKRLRTAKMKRAASAIGVGVAATAGFASIALTVVTAGLAAPFAVPSVLCAAGAVGGVAAGGLLLAVASAQDDVYNIRMKIEGTERDIKRSESKNYSLTKEISQLHSKKSGYMAQRSNLHEEKGKMKEVIAFLVDAKVYGNQFSTVTRGGINRTALIGRLVSRVETRGYSLFDSSGVKRALAMFEEAWAVFEKMNKSGSNHVFEMDFQCTRATGHTDSFLM